MLRKKLGDAYNNPSYILTDRSVGSALRGCRHIRRWEGSGIPSTASDTSAEISAKGGTAGITPLVPANVTFVSQRLVD